MQVGAGDLMSQLLQFMQIYTVDAAAGSGQEGATSSAASVAHSGELGGWHTEADLGTSIATSGRARGYVALTGSIDPFFLVPSHCRVDLNANFSLCETCRAGWLDRRGGPQGPSVEQKKEDMREQLKQLRDLRGITKGAPFYRAFQYPPTSLPLHCFTARQQRA
eukprot:COSAG05_NODE_2415_length_3092_cov_13.057802_3_plen_164_part_00